MLCTLHDELLCRYVIYRYSPKRTYSDAFFPIEASFKQPATKDLQENFEINMAQEGEETEQLTLLDLTTFSAWSCEFILMS